MRRMKNGRSHSTTYTVSTGKTTIVFTRMRAPYVNPNSFRFTIYRKGFFSGIGKFFGMQDIEIGDASSSTTTSSSRGPTSRRCGRSCHIRSFGT